MYKTKLRNKKFKRASILYCFSLVVGLGFAQVSYSATNLKLAPISLSIDSGGQLGYTLYKNLLPKANGVAQSLSLSVYSTARARSYINHPAIAPIDGYIGLGYGNSVSNTRKFSGLTNSGSLTLNSGVNMVLRPRSRFATNFSINQSASRDLAFKTSSTTRNYGIKQNYQSPGRIITWGSVSLGHRNTNASNAILNEVDDAFSLNLNHIFTNTQRVIFDWGVTRKNLPNIYSSTLTNLLLGEYRYRGNVRHTLNAYYSNYKLRQRNYGNGSSSKTQQLSGYGSIIVSPKLSIYGNARLGQLRSGGLTTNIASGLSYRLSSRISASGSFNTSDQSGRIQQTSFSASISASNAFGEGSNQSKKLGAFTYRRFTRASLSFSGSSSAQGGNTSQQSINSSQGVSLILSAGHSIAHTTNLHNGKLTSNANQTTAFSTSTSGFAGFSPLNTNGSMGWSHIEKLSKANTLIRVSANDSRPLKNNSNSATSRLLNLQATHSRRLFESISFSGSLTGQSTSYDNVRGSSAYASATMGYRNRRLFKVRNLSFTSSVLTYYNLRAADNTSKGQLNWDNRFNYVIGELTALLDINFAKAGKNNSGFLRFELRRVF